MIERLKVKHTIDIIEFLERVPDKYEDIYITSNRERIFLKKNWYLTKKLLKHQEVYGLFKGELRAFMIIYREKGFRPYLKIISENSKYAKDLIKFLMWNYLGTEIFLKLKINNPLLDEFVKRIRISNTFTKFISKGKFYVKGLRGQEILLIKKAIRVEKKLKPKDKEE